MPLTDQQIADHVQTIVYEIGKKSAPTEFQPLIDAGAALITNLLQNINALATRKQEM